MHHPEVLVVGSISTKELDSNPLDSVHDKFKKWTHIMSKEEAKRLPEHTSYDHGIDIRTGVTPPWGPCYALSEKKLEVLKEWL
jgi:predicted transcriptional regulator